MTETLLKIQNLEVSFKTRRGYVKAVDGFSVELSRGETLGIVGESGSGKSVTSLSVMGLLPPTASVQADAFTVFGKDWMRASESVKQSFRGKTLSMIFQDPMSSLNPTLTVGFQIEECLSLHEKLSARERRARARELLQSVGIPEPERRLKQFPHELSGGMCQRVMIAIAIACQASFLIADEPTTALDVTIQAQILELLKRIQSERQMTLILITHDIGVVAEYTDRVTVMYAGQVVEEGKTFDVLKNPKHPYTAALLACLPGRRNRGDAQAGPARDSSQRKKIPAIPGIVPSLFDLPKGCRFEPRCGLARPECKTWITELLSAGGSQRARCLKVST